MKEFAEAHVAGRKQGWEDQGRASFVEWWLF